MIWLRLHTSVKDDRQLQQMPAELFRHLVNLWCLAKEYGQGGKLPPPGDAAFQLRIPEDEYRSVEVKLAAMGLLVIDGGEATIKNWTYWNDRDDSKNRVKKHRNGSTTVTPPLREPLRNRYSDVTVTLTDREIELDREIEGGTVTRDLVERWTEKLCEAHPSPCDGRYPNTFCSDHWIRLGEDSIKYEAFMAVVYEGLTAWCVHWEIDGNRFAKSLDNWLSGFGWKKKPPHIVERNGRTPEAQRIADSWELP